MSAFAWPADGWLVKTFPGSVPRLCGTHACGMFTMRRFNSSSQSLNSSMLPTKANGVSYEALHGRKPTGAKANCVKIVAALIIVGLCVLLFKTVASPPDRVYGLMIDAGSTGSRIHTFTFARDSSKKLNLITEDFKALKPGLSSYKDDPPSAAASLLPLLERAKEIVPADKRSETPVFLRATAGLRMTGEEKAAAILEQVHRTLGSSGFRFDGPEWASILGGDDEGIYSWITVNYLLKTNSEDTVGTLEMGGGSAQIAFTPRDGSHGAPGNCSTPAHMTKYKGASLPLYTFSNLKFGLKMGRSVALNHFKDSGLTTNNPCVNTDMTGTPLSIAIPFDETEKSIAVQGSGNFAACRKVVDEAVTRPAYTQCMCGACTYHSVAAPKPISEYYAFAFYLERTVAIGMKTPMHVDDLIAKGEEVCAMSVQQIRKMYPSIPNGDATDLCLDLAFITSHLEYGHGITRDTGTVLNLVDKISGVELGWSLGAMFAELQKLNIGH